jgi:hypothetical protein
MVDAAHVTSVGAFDVHVLADLGWLDHAMASISFGRHNDAQAEEVSAMAEPINLNKARKARAAADAKALAAENRVKFGRAKSEKAVSKLEAERARRALDQAKRED